MHPSTIALIMAPIALIEGWALLRACQTGEISSRGWTFQRTENPLGFWALAAIDVCIMAGIGWFALYTMGVVGGMPASITIPRFG